MLSFSVMLRFLALGLTLAVLSPATAFSPGSPSRPNDNAARRSSGFVSLGPTPGRLLSDAETKPMTAPFGACTPR